MASRLIDSTVERLNKARGYLTRNGLRNSHGYMHTFDRILQSVRNLEDSQMGVEPMKAVFRGFSERSEFSEGAGLNAVANTKGIDVVDISVMTAVNSFIPYVAVERGMAKATDVLTFQVLEAINTAGGLTAGNTAVHPFKPININLNLARSAASSTLSATGASTEVPVALDFNYPIAKGTIVATYTPSGGTAIAGAAIS